MSFQYIEPTEEQKELMKEFRDRFEQLMSDIEIIGRSRGISLVKTKLEEASFWLNKSITNNDN